MKDKILLAIFVIHLAAFIFLYLKRKHYHSLFFALGFICLVSWKAMQVFEYRLDIAKYIEYGGIFFCAVGTPFFIVYLVKIIKRKFGPKAKDTKSA